MFISDVISTCLNHVKTSSTRLRLSSILVRLRTFSEMVSATALDQLSPKAPELANLRNLMISSEIFLDEDPRKYQRSSERMFSDLGWIEVASETVDRPDLLPVSLPGMFKQNVWPDLHFRGH